MTQVVKFAVKKLGEEEYLKRTSPTEYEWTNLADSEEFSTVREAFCDVIEKLQLDNVLVVEI